MSSTLITGNQVLPGSLGVIDLSATGTRNSTTYLRGDNTWSTLTAADIATTTTLPTISETISANLSATVNRSYTIALGTKLTLGLASRFRVL